ncbi:MAG: ABC transporter permease [Armatimonadetes bacterium]|nr:ABC transporter permease [Armatimonadota bacterium]
MKVLAALARNTVLQAIRLRAVAFVGLLTLALFPFILLHLKSTGSPKAELQVLLTYSIGFISFVLSLLTIFLATWSLCGEIQDRQIFILDTKPVHRWQILLGKWAGILLLDTAILAAMAGFTYALIRLIEGRASPRDRQQIWDELLVGRKGVRPTLPDLSAQVREEYEKRKVEGALPEGAAEENVLLQIRREVYQRQETVPPRMTKTWEFRDLPRPDDIMARRPLALRFKLYTSNPVAKRHIKGKWRIWARYGNTQFQVPPGKTPAGAFQEITLPAGVLPQEGKLLVAFTNLETTCPSPSPAGCSVASPATCSRSPTIPSSSISILRGGPKDPTGSTIFSAST